MKSNRTLTRPPPAWLRVEFQSEGLTCTLMLSGALSGTSIAALETQIDQLCSTAWDTVVIDVGQVSAIDAVGANVLVGLSHYVSARGGYLSVVGASGDVAVALRNCGLGATLGPIGAGFESGSAEYCSHVVQPDAGS